eukprot:351583-Chlamydomonas_euryale.AAC.6
MAIQGHERPRRHTCGPEFLTAMHAMDGQGAVYLIPPNSSSALRNAALAGASFAAKHSLADCWVASTPSKAGSASPSVAKRPVCKLRVNVRASAAGHEQDITYGKPNLTGCKLQRRCLVGAWIERG